jgi:hypothetical protein
MIDKLEVEVEVEVEHLMGHVTTFDECLETLVAIDRPDTPDMIMSAIMHHMNYLNPELFDQLREEDSP